MIVRCKVFVANAECQDYGYSTTRLNLVYSPDPKSENYKFHSSSPSGHMILKTSRTQGQPCALDEFVPGSFWYVDSERVDEITQEEGNAFLVLIGKEMSPNCPLVDGKLAWKPGESLHVKLVGSYNGLQVEQFVYIANDKVYSEYKDLGTFYKLTFTQTTREGG